jgi:hypothetical protein
LKDLNFQISQARQLKFLGAKRPAGCKSPRPRRRAPSIGPHGKLRCHPESIRRGCLKDLNVQIYQARQLKFLGANDAPPKPVLVAIRSTCTSVPLK